MSPARMLAVYRVIFSALIIVAGVQALATHSYWHHVVPLATVEIAGALLLIWRGTQWFGACLLLGVFACAQVISAIEGAWPTHFLQYAASTILIVTMDRAFAG